MNAVVCLKGAQQLLGYLSGIQWIFQGITLLKLSVSSDKVLKIFLWLQVWPLDLGQRNFTYQPYLGVPMLLKKVISPCHAWEVLNNGAGRKVQISGSCFRRHLWHLFLRVGGKFKVMGGSTTNWLKLDLRSFFSEPWRPRRFNVQHCWVPTWYVCENSCRGCLRMGMMGDGWEIE